ncbi:L,D-transpeptidase [Marimonas lutisalis]|uniref:L,D-transpeptidase n=1 Tax=Marimonas lutisalis TaxID=2545756 RepID=UPI0010F43BD9|nr:L,D-transpeptidase [Marimonas lutisalis]
MLARLALLVVLLASRTDAGELEAHIDLSDQQMTVYLDGQALYFWPVSTARAGKFTPIGLYAVQSMKRMHYSTLYHNAPMPWSIFFSGNFAIHGTDQINRLGRPASAGCVRLHPANAETLYRLILQYGRAHTTIHITR